MLRKQMLKQLHDNSHKMFKTLKKYKSGYFLDVVHKSQDFAQSQEQWDFDILKFFSVVLKNG